MNTNGIVDSVVKAGGLKPAAAQVTAAATAALAPLISLLPKVVPYLARSVRRHPLQAAIAGAGLLLLAVVQRRHSTRRRYSPFLK